MKIAFFHELPYGGARRAVKEYGRILKSRHEIDLYYVDEVEDQKINEVFTSVSYHWFLPKKREGKDFKTRLFKDTIELYRLFHLHQKIAKKIDGGNYDFVFVHPSRFTQAPFVLRFLKTKKIYFCQEPLRIVYDENLKISKNLPFIKRVYELINRIIRKRVDLINIRHSDIILANSKFSKKWIKESYDLESDVCYLGVDANQFRPLKLKKEYDILFLGEKDKIEGYDLLIAALNLFKKKPTVKVIGRTKTGIGVSQEELVRAYNRAEVVVCLSQSEPFGLIPLEAMACGVPVTAVREGGFE
ncbi:glycosyltransferase family 4 protein, partial [Patescibacteria group bacterium]|nr:glycosyltransferase family 4 protein [Patescibacteria group bacterium]